MKALPEYLENIISHLAECEEKQGGLKKPEAIELFRKELFNESLTAKANPSPKTELNPNSESSKKLVQDFVDEMISRKYSAAKIVSTLKRSNYHASTKAVEKYMASKNPIVPNENPTIKSFHEIYTAAGERFANSYLGKKLGYKFRSGKEANIKTRDEAGKALPEAKKYYSSKQKAGIDRKLKVSKEFISDGKGGGVWKNIKSYEPVDPNLLTSDGYKFFETLRNFSNNTSESILRCFYGEKTKRPNKSLGKGWANHSDGEYVKNEMVTKGEMRDDVERNRYMQLMVSSIVFGTIEPLFDLTPTKLDALLEKLMSDIPKNELYKSESRQAFVKKVLEYTKNKGQL